MTREGQGTPEPKPRPPASTRWAEPGSVQGTGPVPPFVPRRRPSTEQPTAAHVGTEPGGVADDAGEGAEWAPHGADTDDVAGITDHAVADIDDAATDPTGIAGDTPEVDAGAPDSPPILEFDISGPFAPLPRDQGGWVPEDVMEQDEPLVYHPADVRGERAATEEEMVPVSELPTPSEAADARAETTTPGEPPADEPARAAGSVDDGEPDLAVELADRLDVLAARLREEGAEGAREEMESLDRFTALVAGLVSGFLAGHGR